MHLCAAPLCLAPDEHERFPPHDACTSHPADAHELFTVSAGDACWTGLASLVYTLARRRNFGDMMSPIITRFVAGAPALPIGLDLFQLHKDSGNSKARAQHIVNTFKESLIDTAQPRPALFALGSILHHARGFSQAERRAFLVWGSGLKDGDGKGQHGEPPIGICDPNKTESAAIYFSQVARAAPASRKARGSYLPLPASTWADDLDVRATRGPLTLRLLRTAGARVPTGVPYGDPALLLPWVYPKCFRACRPRAPVCLVVHFLDTSSPDIQEATSRGIPWRSALMAPERMIEFILDCGLVVSSSLHGLITAESFGVPARWILMRGAPESMLGPRKCARDHAEPVAKFYDYFLGTGRTSPRPAGSLAEALALGGEQPLPADVNVTALYQAFPQERVRGCAWSVPLERRLELLAQPVGQSRKCYSRREAAPARTQLSK